MLSLKLITVIVREADDAVVGFAITLPSMSRAMQKSKGAFFTFGFIHLLKALYLKPKIIDLYLIGILPEYQHKGVNSLLFTDLLPQFIRTGAEYCESNLELETNNAVLSQWQYFKTEFHKRRRAYIKKI
jgi:ribosomal protein S18 acetylase RimI-like enzyme